MGIDPGLRHARLRNQQLSCGARKGAFSKSLFTRKNPRVMHAF
jgi:hypothetical protein